MVFLFSFFFVLRGERVEGICVPQWRGFINIFQRFCTSLFATSLIFCVLYTFCNFFVELGSVSVLPRSSHWLPQRCPVCMVSSFSMALLFIHLFALFYISFFAFLLCPHTPSHFHSQFLLGTFLLHDFFLFSFFFCNNIRVGYMNFDRKF